MKRNSPQPIDGTRSGFFDRQIGDSVAVEPTPDAVRETQGDASRQRCGTFCSLLVS